MKIMLISESADSGEKLKSILKENNFELIHYRSPVKALDNMKEVMPDAIIVNTRDFPRHWKVITQYIRWDTAKEKIIIILLADNNFDQSNADKAVKAGVQGIIKIEDNNFIHISEELKSIFMRYGYFSEKKSAVKNIAEKIQFLFINPLNEIIITGTVKNITETGILFLPDMPANTSELKEGETLTQCSLKIGNDVISPVCKIKSNTLTLNLIFAGLNQTEHSLIADFISAA